MAITSYINYNETITKNKTIQDTKEEVIEYVFENNGISDVDINGKIVEPGKVYNTGVGFLSLDQTSYRIVFMQPAMIKSLLLTKKIILKK